MKKLLILTSIILASCGSGSSADTSSADQVYLAVGNGVPACRSSDIDINIAKINSSFKKFVSEFVADNFSIASKNLTDIKLTMHSLDFQYYENSNVVGYARLDNSRLDAHVDALIEDVSYWTIYRNDFSGQFTYSLAQLNVSYQALSSQIKLFTQGYYSLCSTVGFNTELVPIDG
jgi:hypothetical protein